MVVVIVTEAGINIRAQLCISEITLDVIACIRWNHERFDKVVVEEMRHVHRSVIRVKSYLLVFKLLFDRWYIVLNFDHKLALFIVKRVFNPGSSVVCLLDCISQIHLLGLSKLID